MKIKQFLLCISIIVCFFSNQAFADTISEVSPTPMPISVQIDQPSDETPTAPISPQSEPDVSFRAEESQSKFVETDVTPTAPLDTISPQRESNVGFSAEESQGEPVETPTAPSDAITPPSEPDLDSAKEPVEPKKIITEEPTPYSDTGENIKPLKDIPVVNTGKSDENPEVSEGNLKKNLNETPIVVNSTEDLKELIQPTEELPESKDLENEISKEFVPDDLSPEIIKNNLTTKKIETSTLVTVESAAFNDILNKIPNSLINNIEVNNLINKLTRKNKKLGRISFSAIDGITATQSNQSLNAQSNCSQSNEVQVSTTSNVLGTQYNYSSNKEIINLVQKCISNTPLVGNLDLNACNITSADTIDGLDQTIISDTAYSKNTSLLLANIIVANTVSNAVQNIYNNIGSSSVTMSAVYNIIIANKVSNVVQNALTTIRASTAISSLQNNYIFSTEGIFDSFAINKNIAIKFE